MKDLLTVLEELVAKKAGIRKDKTACSEEFKAGLSHAYTDAIILVAGAIQGKG